MVMGSEMDCAMQDMMKSIGFSSAVKKRRLAVLTEILFRGDGMMDDTIGNLS